MVPPGCSWGNVRMARGTVKTALAPPRIPGYARAVRWLAIAVALIAARAHAGTIRCDDLSTEELTIDGMLDDWKPAHVAARAGDPPNGAIALRCAWDGNALAVALDIADDRVVRVAGGRGHEDHVDIAIAAGARPVRIAAYPGNPVARPKLAAPAHVAVADSLQPAGFSLELRVPAAAIAGLSASTPSLELHLVFHDSDRATGGADHDVALDATIELADRKELLDDFLSTVQLRRGDLKLDTLAELDPERRGKERLVAGGTVIGVLTDRYAFVTLPAASPADVLKVELLPLGPRGQQIVSAVVRQHGNGGSRDLLMLWVVWSGQLSPLGSIEVRKQDAGNVLESTWKIARGRKGPELLVEPRPAIGWSADSWNEQPADDADPIALPWDPTKRGTAYALSGAELSRRDLPAPKHR